MDNADFKALIELRDDIEDPEDKKLLRRTIRYIERVDRKVSEAARALDAVRNKVGSID